MDELDTYTLYSKVKYGAEFVYCDAECFKWTEALAKSKDGTIYWFTGNEVIRVNHKDLKNVNLYH